MAGVQYLALGDPDNVIITIADVMFARALEDNERRGMKEDFRTFIQFRSGRVHYLYVEYNDFLTAFCEVARRNNEDTAGVMEP